MRTALLARLFGHHGHGPVVRPVLPVADLDVAEDFHQRIGFEAQRFDDGYAWVHLDDHEVFHLHRVADHVAGANAAEVHLTVDDVDAWHRRCADAGVDPTPVRDEPWGMREFAVIDPGGNRLRFGAHTTGG